MKLLMEVLVQFQLPGCCTRAAYSRECLSVGGSKNRGLAIVWCVKTNWIDIAAEIQPILTSRDVIICDDFLVTLVAVVTE